MKHLVLPTNDNIFVRRIQPVKEVNGIIVPDQSQDRPSEGHIVALGPAVATKASREREITNYMLDKNSTGVTPIDRPARQPEDCWAYNEQAFDLGDHVMFGRFSGIDVTVDEEVYVKLKPDEIYCIIREVAE